MEKIPNKAMPGRQALGTIAVMITAIIVVSAVSTAQILYSWTPLQRYYLPDLATYTLARVLHLPNTEHRFVGVALSNGATDFARESDFVQGQMQGIDGYSFPFAPSKQAMQEHRTRIFRGKKVSYETKSLGQLFRLIAFPALTAKQFSQLPAVSGLVTMGLGLWLALPWDRDRARTRRFGRRLRGPEYVGPRDFVRRLRADGVGFPTKARGVWRWLSGQKYISVRIPRASEASGIGILGATGSGKSAVAFQLIAQAIARGERVVVLDAGLEFIQRFLDPEKHTVLNTGDERTAAWDLKAEVGSGAEARALACSMLPHRKNEQPFFVEAAQRVLAELLKHRPSAKELAAWLTDPAEVDRRLVGTEAARMIDPHAGPQRVGVLATLAMFGEALRSVPEISPAHKPWSSAEWVKSGSGCIFLTFPPMMREQLRPLIGTWLDLLIYRLQRTGFTGAKTWIIVDEMPTLGLLPAMTGALTENRKSGNPIVYCVQDKSQLDAAFGEVASAMLSMPPTKIIFRTSEPSSAKWASQALGNVEYEQVRESETTTHQGKTQTEHIEFVTRPLVMPEQLDALPPLTGYIKHGNLVTDLETYYPDFPRIQPGFVPRVEPSLPDSRAVTPVLKTPDTGAPQVHLNDSHGLLFE
jgi:hypothetical protein